MLTRPDPPPVGHPWHNRLMPLELDRDSAWLSREDLDQAREKLPILYVDLVPVRVDERGTVTGIGLLLRVNEDGRITRELVSGRVLHHERLRDAILRHVEKDLGPMALPRIPLSPQPFTVAEYFPTPGVTPFHDPWPVTVRRNRTRSTSPGSPRTRPATPPCSPISTAATTSCCVRPWRTSGTRSDRQELDPRLNLSTLRVMSWWSRSWACSGVGAVPPRRAGR